MWTDRGFWALLGLGLLVRVAFVWILDPQMAFKGDEHVYTEHARELVDTGAFNTGWFVRPPLYFLFLASTALFTDWTGLSWTLVSKLLQCLASAATAIPIYRGAQRITGSRAARIAVGFFLFDPTSIGFSAMLWPETVYTLAVAMVFDSVTRMDDQRPGHLALLGGITGMAMLLKPVFGLYTVFLALYWLRNFGWANALRRTLVFGGVAAAVISPWIIRNQLEYGPSIILENQGPYNLWSGNSPHTPRSVLTAWRQKPDPVTRTQFALEQGRAAIAADPGRFAANYGTRLVGLWGFEFFVYRHLVGGGFGWGTRARMARVFWVLQAGWMLMWIAASLGIATTMRDPTLRLVGGYALGFTLLVAAMVATTRFRVPFAYLLAISAGIGIDRLLDRCVSRRDLIVVGIAGGTLIASATRPLFWMLISGDFVNAGDVNQNLDWMWFRY
jgi:hypothetical protein